jgi:hypothetical protein
LKVPDFGDGLDESEKGRELLSLAELDVARDVMDITFVLRSEVE